MPDAATNYHTVMPYLVVADGDAEVTFLTGALGGREQSLHRTEQGRIMHAEILIGDSLVMVGEGNDQWKPLPAALYLWVDDVDATYERALAGGATSQSPPEDKPYGQRNAGVVDPNGITWWIGSPVRSGGR